MGDVEIIKRLVTGISILDQDANVVVDEDFRGHIDDLVIVIVLAEAGFEALSHYALILLPYSKTYQKFWLFTGKLFIIVFCVLAAVYNDLQA